MNKSLAVIAALALLALCSAAQTDVFNLDTGLTSLQMVEVGDAENVGEHSGSGASGWGMDRICGSVAYNYHISKYEITSAQYCDFLNYKAKSDPNGLYNPVMSSNSYGCQIQRTGVSGSYSYSVASDWANRPVNLVSFWDSCRFVNWLCNGQGNGDTETGAYTLKGYKGADGSDIKRNNGSKWAVTSEAEWYKAAYYKGGGKNAGYWDFPTTSNTVPANQLLITDTGNTANFSNGNYTIGSPYYRNNVGEFNNSASAYGTFDQAGNIWEWNEALIFEGTPNTDRGIRGGSYYGDFQLLQASYRSSGCNPTIEASNIGFRIVGVPEPSGICALITGLGLLIGMRRRRV